MRLFISGSLAYDRLMSFPRNFDELLLPDQLHNLNVCFLVEGLREVYGGTAGNIAYSLAMLNERPTILAATGHDFDKYEARIKGWGLPLDGLRRIEEEPTSSAFITADRSGNQITLFCPGAMNHIAEYDFSGVDPQNALAIVSPGNLADMARYPETYKKMGLPYILDPGQNIPAFPKDTLVQMITGARVLITNDYELKMIEDITGLDQAGLLGRVGALITTFGAEGSVLATSQGQETIGAVPVAKALDPTGAGDAYRAGLLKGLALGKPLIQAARMGATAAAYSVEQNGTQFHRFTWEEFLTRRRAFFGDD
jgi:adenosine kinase